MFLAAGEVGEGEGIFLVADGAKVALQAVFDIDGGLGVTMGDDSFDPRLGDERVDDGLGFLGGDEKVEVVHGFLAAAQAAGGFGARRVGVLAENVKDLFGTGGDVAEAEAVAVLLAKGDGFENLVGGFFSEARKFGDFAGLDGGSERIERIDAESVVEGFDFFRTHLPAV